MVENEAIPVTFQVMDWNRLEKHELVGFAMISSAELRLLLDQDTGYECHLALPVLKAGAVVEGVDHHKCHLKVTVKVLQALPKPAVAHPKKRVSKALPPSIIIFARLGEFLCLQNPPGPRSNIELVFLSQTLSQISNLICKNFSALESRSLLIGLVH